MSSTGDAEVGFLLSFLSFFGAFGSNGNQML